MFQEEIAHLNRLVTSEEMELLIIKKNYDQEKWN